MTWRRPATTGPRARRATRRRSWRGRAGHLSGRLAGADCPATGCATSMVGSSSCVCVMNGPLDDGGIPEKCHSFLRALPEVIQCMYVIKVLYVLVVCDSETGNGGSRGGESVLRV